MSPSSSRHDREPRRLREETEEESFGSLPNQELLALISEGGFSGEDSCDAVEEALRRGLECPDAIPLMRDLLFGFETSTLRYRAAISLARLKVWDDDVHRALCHAVSKLPGDDPLARSARLQLQKRGLSSGSPPERPTVGAFVGHAAPAGADIEASPKSPKPVTEPESSSASPRLARSKAAVPESPAIPQDITALPRYTTEDVEEPRLRYRRRKRKRGEAWRQVFSNVQMLLVFVVAFAIFIAILGRC